MNQMFTKIMVGITTSSSQGRKIKLIGQIAMKHKIENI